MVKRGLGSGLSALLENNSMQSAGTEKIELIDINNIKPNKNQPRKSFNEEKLTELSQSIKENGIIQPIVVQRKDNSYMIVAGERRYRASKMAQLKELPCIVKDYSDEQLIKVSLLENIQREDLNPLEEAETYKSIIKEFNLTQDTLAKELGKSRTHVSNMLRLLKLSDKVKSYILDGKLSYGHARTLVSIESVKEQEELAESMIFSNLNVRDSEKITKTKKTAKKGKMKEIPEYKDLEKKLRDYLGTKVKVVSGKSLGKIEIDYFGDEDLERIYDLIRN